MKQLTLIRHAKSDRSNAELSDAQRPLNKRGLRDASQMAALYAQKFQPTHWFVSPALRAQQTARFFTDVLKTLTENIITTDVLYSFSLQQVYSFLQTINDNVHHAALVFHNPTISELANYLNHTFINEVPTCAIITFQFEIDSWLEISGNSGILLDFDYPKKHDWAQ
jgi:phosphohistidine phosphatase